MKKNTLVSLRSEILVVRSTKNLVWMVFPEWLFVFFTLVSHFYYSVKSGGLVQVCLASQEGMGTLDSNYHRYMVFYSERDGD